MIVVYLPHKPKQRLHYQMETIYLCIVIFLFALAIFDLTVGVSNDAVNFLNSAIGSKTASFKAIIFIAAIGVFAGASMSNGMMDIARHGMFNPQYFTFQELMYLFMAVIVADIILLDTFNSLGLPTSTTVSMVFELLGATFCLAMIKVYSDQTDVPFADHINTDKALTVIIGIFLSVAIAFFFGSIVQWISRVIFTFKYTRNLKWKIGIFGGFAITSIIYFMLIKGLKDNTLMTADTKTFIEENTWTLMLCSFVGFTLLMQVLHFFKINVFKIVVMLGTFSLAMAFAGNDLVNFIGVPLAGYESYGYFIEEGCNLNMPMNRLNDPHTTPIYFLIIAGVIMVVALATSKKAHNVVKTSVDLARQDGGDEMFGSSKAARRLVRTSNNIGNWFINVTPARVRHWINNRFDTTESDMPEGAAFDLVRASVNLVLAGLLVALGTSMKLPLSTTYVTFMVAMGSSLADRAWSRESAVFRITGVISVIGGWLITAGAAFTISSIMVIAMYFGGIYVTIAIAAVAIGILVHSNVKFSKKGTKDTKSDEIFHEMAVCKDRQRTFDLLQQHIALSQADFMRYICKTYTDVTEGFLNEELKPMRKAYQSLPKEKALLKSIRRKHTLGIRRIEPHLAIENNTWLHLSYNNSQQMVYCLMRMTEPCLEHVDNNFAPLSDDLKAQFIPVRDKISELLTRSLSAIETEDYDLTVAIRNESDEMKATLSNMRKALINHIHEDMDNYSVIYVYLNILQESQEMISSLRHMLRAVRKIEREN